VEGGQAQHADHGVPEPLGRAGGEADVVLLPEPVEFGGGAAQPCEQLLPAGFGDVPGHRRAELAGQAGSVLLPVQPRAAPGRVGEVQQQRVAVRVGHRVEPDQPVITAVEGQDVPARVLHRGGERVELADQGVQKRRDVRDLGFTGRLGHPGQGEQVAAFRRVQQQGIRDGLQHLDRRADRSPLFQPGVPGHPDRGQFGDLLTAQAGRAPPVGDTDTDLVRADPFPAAAQERGELGPPGPLTFRRGGGVGASRR